MKRRSFLQSIAAGIAVLFVPAVAAKAEEKYPFTEYGVSIPISPTGRTLWVNSRTAMFGYGHGTFNHPFATIREAVNVAVSADVIVLKSTHVEKVESQIPLRIVSGVPVVEPTDCRVRINFS